MHTGRADLDRAIAVVCREKGGIPCNTVDSLDGSVVFPAVSRHGNLTVSVSTDGLVPSLSVHIRDRIDSEVQVASRALPVLAFTRERIREMGLNTRPLMRDILSDSRFWAMVEAGGRWKMPGSSAWRGSGRCYMNVGKGAPLAMLGKVNMPSGKSACDRGRFERG
ncbi:hypothetical protein [Thermogymnomonas acidicola]|uniref:hypothetical protein n=1 Tax=Thermogymnomonas acidicola TaxID=399579 RepID=UPI001396897B|nr:hypothetical protein [Thermogymnomonas acidicola]